MNERLVMMQRTVKGVVQRRAMTPYLAESHAARQGGWMRADELTVEVPPVGAKRGRPRKVLLPPTEEQNPHADGDQA
jgi:hypothetical protein